MLEEYMEGDQTRWEEQHEDGYTIDGVPVISASNAANIIPGCGFKTPRVFHSILRGDRKSAPNDFQKQLFQYGHDHEGAAMHAYLRLFRVPLCDTAQRTYGKYIRATPDMLTIEDGQFVNVEIKCPHSQKLPEGAPLKYVVQCLLQMHLMRPFIKTRKTMLFFWTPTDCAAYEIQYNQVTAEMLFDALVDFQRDVLNDMPTKREYAALQTLLRARVMKSYFFERGREPAIVSALY